MCVDCDCLYGEVEFGSHWGYPRDMVTASVGGVDFKKPQMVAAFPGSTKGRRWLAARMLPWKNWQKRIWQETTYRDVTCLGPSTGGRMGGHLKQVTLVFIASMH